MSAQTMDWRPGIRYILDTFDDLDGVTPSRASWLEIVDAALRTPSRAARERDTPSEQATSTNTKRSVRGMQPSMAVLAMESRAAEVMFPSPRQGAQSLA